MDAGGHQLWPVSQVTTLAIVTSRLKPLVYILRSCSGSVGSCPFTLTRTNELEAKHDVITPIWLGTGWLPSLVPVSPDSAPPTGTKACQPQTSDSKKKTCFLTGHHVTPCMVSHSNATDH